MTESAQSEYCFDTILPFLSVDFLQKVYFLFIWLLRNPLFIIWTNKCVFKVICHHFFIQVGVGRLLNCVSSLGMILISSGMFFWKKRTCWWLSDRCWMLRTWTFPVPSVFQRCSICSLISISLYSILVFLNLYNALQISTNFSSEIYMPLIRTQLYSIHSCSLLVWSCIWFL